MVNVGGPSKGCITCIQRKIRCDRQRPVCGQCIKSTRRCGGYRNETDVMFRDQSQMVYARESAASQAQAQKSEEGEVPRSSDSPESDVPEGMTSSVSDDPVMIRSPKLDAESGLITFFTNNFTCNDSNRGSNLYWVPANFDDLLKHDCAKLSVQSVGAMAIARLQRSPYYQREAQKKYGSTLLSLTRMWRDHVEMDNDAVLITVLFLSFFEILASHDSTSRQSWMAHLGGLGIFLERRKEDFLSTDFGARMLLQSRNQVILNALQTKTPVPEAFRRPTERVPRSIPLQLIASSDASILLTRLADVQARYRFSGPSNALISELTALNRDFSRWAESSPLSWHFSAQPSGIPSTIRWEMRRDVYSVTMMAHVWNNIRAAQIIIYDLIQEITWRLSSSSENRMHLTKNQLPAQALPPELLRLVDDVCATVPIYYRPSSATARPGAVGSQPLLGTAYWLLWVLEIMGSMRQAPRDLTEWVLECLERIYETTGIVKAKLGAERIRLRQRGAVVA